MAAASYSTHLMNSGSTFGRLDFAFVVIADCLRRGHGFAAALERIEFGLRAEVNARARVQLEYERCLVESEDTSAHRDDETPGWQALAGETCDALLPF
jgi:hypothetical protein